jgi:hypothetical protein
MFFLLRMAFWLGLVLVLLPREKTPESEKLPQIGASQAVQAATAAVSDMSQFCKRQPQACEVGGQAASVIGQRAEDGARKLYKIITDKKAPDTATTDKRGPDGTDKRGPDGTDKRGPDRTGSIGAVENADAPTADQAPRDTLTSDDLVAEWRMPSPP